MKRISVNPRPCYTALAEKIDMRALLNPDNLFVIMAHDLDFAFGHQIQHAAWHKFSGRTAVEYLMMCINDTAFVFEGPTFDQMLIATNEHSPTTRVAIVPYYLEGINHAAIDSYDSDQKFRWPLVSKDFEPCPICGPELVDFVVKHLEKTPVDIDGYTVNRWRGPKPSETPTLGCNIL